MSFRRRIILMYHRVGGDLVDPWGLQVSPEHFEGHLRVLRETAAVCSLQDLRDPATRGPRVAVTFDDGYVDNLERALPQLRDLGVPATVFITSNTVGDRRGFWWDRLSVHMLGGEIPERHLRMRVAGTGLVMDVGTRAARDRAHRFLHARLRLLPPDAVDRALRDLATAIESDRRVPESALPMTEDEVRALAAEQLISIGGHAATHRALPALEEAGQREELMKGKRRLEEIVGKPVRFLAYPYGEYDAITLRIAREVFDLAVTTNEGDAAASDALQLPRYTVRNWPAHQFRAWLKSWLEG